MGGSTRRTGENDLRPGRQIHAKTLDGEKIAGYPDTQNERNVLTLRLQGYRQGDHPAFRYSYGNAAEP
jgi:hypothetical protein